MHIHTSNFKIQYI